MPAKSHKMSPWQIKKIIARGSQWRGRYFSVKYSKNFGKIALPIRIAVVISKKTLAQARERNLCRRRVKAAFQQSEDAARGFDLIIFPAKSALTADFAKLESEVKACLNALR